MKNTIKTTSNWLVYLITIHKTLETQKKNMINWKLLKPEQKNNVGECYLY